MKILFVLLALPFYYHGFAHQTKDSIAVKYAETITSLDLSMHLNVLASDEYEGRETGMHGQKMAGDYIARYFKEYGLPEIGDVAYKQSVPLLLKYPEGVNISAGNNRFECLKDFYFFRGAEDTTIQTGEVLFLGYGIDDSDYSDYADHDVNNKVVMVLDGEPVGKKGISHLTASKNLSEWSLNYRMKATTAKKQGVGVLLVVVDDFENKLERVRHFVEQPAMKLDSDKKSSNTRTPVFYISEEMADQLIGSTMKSSITRLKKKIDKKGKPVNLSIPTKFEMAINRKTERISAENVLGYVEGTDLKDELLIITAHYDHIGKDGDEIYNGADDDGSGTVAVMELAEAFAKAKAGGHGPRRSILFMPVAGEEKGLLGSEYYTQNPVFPLKNTIANLNIDMIGRIDEKHEGNADYVYLIGSDKLSTELHEISEYANKIYINLELDYTFNDPDDPNRFYYRSDHYNFAKNNIPVIFYFNGVHEDYHQPTDTVDKINFDKMERITRLVFHTAWDLANRDKRIEVDVDNEFKD